MRATIETRTGGAHSDAAHTPTHASVHRGQTGPCTRAAQRLSAALSIRSCRACSDRTPSMGCASVGHRDSGSPINKRERNVRRTLLATPMRLVRNGNELRPQGRRIWTLVTRRLGHLTDGRASSYLSLATPIRLGKHANGLPPLARNLPPMVPISIGRNADAQRPWRLGDWVKFE